MQAYIASGGQMANHPPEAYPMTNDKGIDLSSKSIVTCPNGVLALLPYAPRVSRTSRVVWSLESGVSLERLECLE
jgi:hypothetical protein